MFQCKYSSMVCSHLLKHPQYLQCNRRWTNQNHSTDDTHTHTPNNRSPSYIVCAIRNNFQTRPSSVEFIVTFKRLKKKKKNKNQPKSPVAVWVVRSITICDQCNECVCIWLSYVMRPFSWSFFNLHTWAIKRTHCTHANIFFTTCMWVVCIPFEPALVTQRTIREKWIAIDGIPTQTLSKITCMSLTHRSSRWALKQCIWFSVRFL